MTLARGFRDFLAYVRPTFMLPAVGMSVYGATLAPATTVWWSTAGIHALTVGLALLVAHLRDGYIDGHIRGEERPRLSVATFRWAIGLFSVVVLLLAGVLTVTADPIAGASVLVLLLLALLHAPYLDRHPVTVTVDYPVGIAATLLGGYAAQSGSLTIEISALAALFVGLLAGIKIGIDQLDADFDASIGKQTVPVVAGARGGDRIAVGVFGLTAAATVAIGLAGVLGVLSIRPVFAFIAAIAPLLCLFATLRLTDAWAVRAQMASTYLFAAALFLAFCDGICGGFVIGERVLRAILG